MSLSRAVGESVPLEEFREAQRAAVAAAGRGRSTYVDEYDVEVVFTIVDGRSDIMRGPEGSHRVVGNTLYGIDVDIAGSGDWMALGLDDTRDTNRYLVRNAEASRRVGTPLTLIDGLGGADPTVVAADGELTTYAVELSSLAFYTAIGVQDVSEAEPPVSARWTVDVAERPVHVEHAELPGHEIRFSDWGTAPVVTPPDAEVFDIDELIDRAIAKLPPH